MNRVLNGIRVLDSDIVGEHFAHLVRGTATRYEFPGILAFSFLLTEGLAGGGVSSLRSDPLGKSYAQMLLDIELDVPVDAGSA